MPTQSNIQGGARRTGEHLASEARSLIEENIGRENMEAAIGFLQSFGEVCLRGVKQTAKYARRHPVQVVVGVIAIGFLSSLVAKSRANMKESLH